MDLRGVIRKHALKNAFDYGEAKPGSVVGKVIGEFPEAKKDMKATMKIINEVVKEVNSLSKEQLSEQLSEYEFEKKEEQEKSWDLEGAVKGEVVTRFLPEPNGYPHIGHAKAAWISREFADQWEGDMILRFDDTNPEKEKLEFVDAITDDLKWLGLTWSKQSFTSDLMPTFYEIARKMIENEDAYVCTCDRETISQTRREGKPCECRSRSKQENIQMWEQMLGKKFKKGEAILRLKGDMESLNTVMRDPSLFRINYTTHYRKGDEYCVWPTYDFEVSIADSLDGVTHAFRSKEYELRDELYYYILDKAGLRKPVVYDFSRLNIKGTKLSKRFLRPLIEEGKLSGWDDPRLPSVRGLRRRGILPEAIRNFVVSFGLSKVESEPTWKALFVEEKKLIEPTSDHYFFVASPVKLEVEGATGEEVELAKHPSRENPGVRKIKTGSAFYLAKKDAGKMSEGEELRLKDLYNIKVKSVSSDLVKAEFIGNESIEGRKIQWVTEEGKVPVKVMVLGDLFNEKGEFNEDSLKWDEGFAESAVTGLEHGDVIQFERYGFCRLDSKEKMEFIFVTW